jgi:hypothetical protein
MKTVFQEYSKRHFDQYNANREDHLLNCNVSGHSWFLVNLLLRFGKRCKRHSGMPNQFFEVHLSRNEEMARDSKYVDKFLVELVCKEHTERPSYYQESACEVAMQTLQPEIAAIIGYKAAGRLLPASVPSNRNEGTKAPCGCRSWQF